MGNEPFLKVFKDAYIKTVYLALENIQAALIKAGLGRQVKVTIPVNADVYQTDNGLPSGGDFRSDISDLMLSIIKFLSDNGGPLTINIYPFLSLHMDPNFPIDYAFFSSGASSSSSVVVDGSITYTNVFDANYDTLICALEKHGYSSLPVIIGEVGWPTDGDTNANIQYAKRFNQGLLNRIIQGQGTPKRSSPPDTYLFALIDEDAKDIEPGNFERHWGVLFYDGQLKYDLNIGNNKTLVPAKGVKYLAKQWCIMSPQASLDHPSLPESLSYACTHADCTSLGTGSSCGSLDARGNASYAFNMYYQTFDQKKGTCEFSNLSAITTTDPSQGSCRFEIMIDSTEHKRTRAPAATTIPTSSAVAFIEKSTMMLWIVVILVINIY